MANSWPTPQDYNESLQSPELCFSSPELQTGAPHLDSNGLPRAISGTFASVYRVSGLEHDYAVRCFLHPLSDQFERYKLISEAFKTAPANFMVPFEFQAEGISVNGKWFPLLKMQWVEGETLEQYVHKHLFEKITLKNLLKQFEELCQALESARMAHGDLQPCNLMVTTEGALKLVDYDGFYVPTLQGWKSNELGHPNFQHPSRSPDNFGPHLDNFSIWVIWTSLVALLHHPHWYEEYGAGSDCLLFKRSDFLFPLQSSVFKKLLSDGTKEISDPCKTLLWLTLSSSECHVPLCASAPPYSICTAANSYERPPTSLIDPKVNRYWKQLINKLPMEKVEPELVVAPRKTVLSAENTQSRLGLALILFIFWWIGLWWSCQFYCWLLSVFFGVIVKEGPDQLLISTVLLCWTSTFILLFLIHCILHSRRFTKSQRLVAKGKAVPGIIMEKQETALIYLFEVLENNGPSKMMQGKITSTRPSDFHLAEVGEITTVLYDPFEPETNVLYRFQPYRAL